MMMMCHTSEWLRRFDLAWHGFIELSMRVSRCGNRSERACYHHDNDDSRCVLSFRLFSRCFAGGILCTSSKAVRQEMVTVRDHEETPGDVHFVRLLTSAGGEIWMPICFSQNFANKLYLRRSQAAAASVDREKLRRVQRNSESLGEKNNWENIEIWLSEKMRKHMRTFEVLNISVNNNKFTPTSSIVSQFEHFEYSNCEI